MAKHSPQFLALVDEVKSKIKECTIEDIKSRQTRAEKFLLFDVREDHEWHAGHIPGAQHLGKGIIERDIFLGRLVAHGINDVSCTIKERECFICIIERELGNTSREDEVGVSRDQGILRKRVIPRFGGIAKGASAHISSVLVGIIELNKLSRSFITGRVWEEFIEVYGDGTRYRGERFGERRNIITGCTRNLSIEQVSILVIEENDGIFCEIVGSARIVQRSTVETSVCRVRDKKRALSREESLEMSRTDEGAFFTYSIRERFFGKPEPGEIDVTAGFIFETNKFIIGGRTAYLKLGKSNRRGCCLNLIKRKREE